MVYFTVREWWVAGAYGGDSPLPPPPPPDKKMLENLTKKVWGWKKQVTESPPLDSTYATGRVYGQKPFMHTVCQIFLTILVIDIIGSAFSERSIDVKIILVGRLVQARAITSNVRRKVKPVKNKLSKTLAWKFSMRPSSYTELATHIIKIGNSKTWYSLCMNLPP